MSENPPQPKSSGETHLEVAAVRSESTEQPSVVELTPDKWEEYKTLRLRSRETNPEAWRSSIHTEPEMDESYWREYLEDQNTKMFAVEVAGTAVAMAGLQKQADGSFRLKRVYTAPEMRGKGFGKMLLEKVLQEAEGLGAKSIRLGVTGDTEEQRAAMGLYTSLGFTETYTEDDTMGDGRIHKNIEMEKKFDE